MFNLISICFGLIVRLFSLRRGPALGPILQHADDIDFVRSLFLHSDYSDALRLMCPVLLEAVMSGKKKLFYC